MRHSIISTTRRRGAHMAPRRRVMPFTWLTALLVLVGTCVMLYPPAASWYAAVEQHRESQHYVDSVQDLGAEARAASLAEAHQYNDSLADGNYIVDPFAAIEGTTVKSSDPYWSLMDPAGDGLMARLIIPSLNANLPIYHGTGSDVLLHGVGHLQGTALPVGGNGTHTVLTGHRGLPQATLFDNLDDLKPGDPIEINALGELAVYRVINSAVVLPSETESLHSQSGSDLLTLVTCTPVGINSHRILVTAERVAPSPEQTETPVDAVGFPYWALILGTITALDVIYVARSRR
ncbi:class C sortase [Specibacter sp. NPDC057265]|uniref:class C sortase n=1 Tax=Specibacter sp. NPDC057265 TaxID=3346075 RepID=UPI003631F468